MMEFGLALGIFLIAHVVPSRPAVRRRLVGVAGERAYLAAYSVVSLALLGWLIHAAITAPYLGLWYPEPWHYVLALVAMPAALVLLCAGLMQPNPLSVAIVRGPFEAGRPGIVAVTRHPVLWGFALWGGAHIPPNGDAVSIILFGGLTLFALAGIPILDRRRRRTFGYDRWAEMAAATSALPFVALIAGRARMPRDRRTWLGVVLGLAAYTLLLFGGHIWLFGADPLALL